MDLKAWWKTYSTHPTWSNVLGGLILAGILATSALTWSGLRAVALSPATGEMTSQAWHWLWAPVPTHRILGLVSNAVNGLLLGVAARMWVLARPPATGRKGCHSHVEESSHHRTRRTGLCAAATTATTTPVVATTAATTADTSVRSPRDARVAHSLHGTSWLCRASAIGGHAWVLIWARGAIVRAATGAAAGDGDGERVAWHPSQTHHAWPGFVHRAGHCNPLIPARRVAFEWL